MKRKTKYIIITCPRCDGTCDEPGTPTFKDGSIILCSKCNGKGIIKKRNN
jgi:DnaJ-class molecular chaperone